MTILRRSVFAALSLATMLSMLLTSGTQHADARRQFKPNLVITSAVIGPVSLNGGNTRNAVFITIKNVSQVVGASSSVVRFTDRGITYTAQVPSIARDNSVTVSIPFPFCNGTGVVTADVTEVIGESEERDNTNVVNQLC